MVLDSKLTSTQAEGFYMGMIGGAVQNQTYLQRSSCFHGTETHIQLCFSITLS